MTASCRGLCRVIGRGEYGLGFRVYGLGLRFQGDWRGSTLSRASLMEWPAAASSALTWGLGFVI